MLDKDFIEKNRKRLVAEERRLKSLLDRVAKPDSEVPGEYQARYEDFGNKEDENASEVAQFEVNVAEEKDLEKKLLRVQAALKNVENGRYGVCGRGGEQISRERLEALPEADTCIDHADEE